MLASSLHTIFCLFLIGIFYMFFKNSNYNEEDDIYNWILEIHEIQKKKGPMPKEFYPKNILRTQKPQVKLMKFMAKNIQQFGADKIFKRKYHTSPKISLTSSTTTSPRSPIHDRNLILKQYHLSPNENIYPKAQFQTIKSLPVRKSYSMYESEPPVRMQQLYGPAVFGSLNKFYKSPTNTRKSPTSTESDYPFQYHYN